MNGILKEEFSRAFYNRRYALVALLAAISFTYGFSRVMSFQASSPLDAVTIWQLILQRGSYGFFAALMAGLPFADSLLNDRRRRFIDQILLRSRFNQYLSAKILSTLCAGMTAVAAPALILLIGCCLFFPIDTQFTLQTTLGISNLLNPTVIESGSSLSLSLPGFVLLSLLMLALFGAVYALLGLGSSFLVRNPFIVLGIPFLGYSLGYFILPTSSRLAWLISTEAALLPSSILASPILQYLAILTVFATCLLLWGKKERVLFN
jgi:hypothetical protein